MRIKDENFLPFTIRSSVIGLLCAVGSIYGRTAPGHKGVQVGRQIRNCSDADGFQFACIESVTIISNIFN